MIQIALISNDPAIARYRYRKSVILDHCIRGLCRHGVGEDLKDFELFDGEFLPPLQNTASLDSKSAGRNILLALIVLGWLTRCVNQLFDSTF